MERKNNDDYDDFNTGLSKREIEMRRLMAQKFGRDATHLRPNEEVKLASKGTVAGGKKTTGAASRATKSSASGASSQPVRERVVVVKGQKSSKPTNSSTLKVQAHN